MKKLLANNGSDAYVLGYADDEFLDYVHGLEYLGGGWYASDDADAGSCAYSEEDELVEAAVKLSAGSNPYSHVN